MPCCEHPGGEANCPNHGGAARRARAAVDAALGRMETRERYSDDERARLEHNFPWPSPDSIKAAVESLAQERDRRVVNDLGNALDVGVPKEPQDVVLTDEETVMVVVQALRGQRVKRARPAVAAGDNDPMEDR